MTLLRKIGALNLFLIVFLNGCAKACPPPGIPMMPPDIYLHEGPEPKLKGNPKVAFAEFVLDLTMALQQSNSDKKAIKEWKKMTNQ